VLNQIRALSSESADRLLRALEIEIPDLISRVSAPKKTAFAMVPLLHGRIGPGADADLSVSGEQIPFAAAVVAGLVRPVAAVLGPDLLLPEEVAALDSVVLDQNPLPRAAPNTGLWVVSEGGGLRVRYLRLENDRLLIGNAATRADARRWQVIPISGRNI